MDKPFGRSELAKRLRVNGVAVCDSGHQAFHVGVECDGRGNYFVRLLKCIGCGQEMPVPYRSFADPPPGPTVGRKSVRPA